MKHAIATLEKAIINFDACSGPTDPVVASIQQELREAISLLQDPDNPFTKQERIREFFNVIGGPSGLITMRQHEPQVLETIMTAYQVSFDSTENP